MTSTKRKQALPIKSEQDELYDRFKQHSGLRDTHLESLRRCIIAREYVTSKMVDGDIVDADENKVDVNVKHYKSDGSEFTLADCRLKSVAEAVEETIKIYTPEHRRTELYTKVIQGTQGVNQIPQWDRQEDNPRAKPRTPFSQTRALVNFRETNEEVFKGFALTSALSPSMLARIRGMIIWCDSASSNGTWGGIEWDTFEVRGGRLGLDQEHTLSDVPQCYLRDRLISFTLVDVKRNRRDRVRKSVCWDLTPEQIDEYVAAIEEIERQEDAHRPAETMNPQQSTEVVDRAPRVQGIRDEWKVSEMEADCILRTEELLDAIDDTISLTPRPVFAARKKNICMPDPDSSLYPPQRWSVLEPGTWAGADEIPLPRNCHIDRDCDQVRAMIKIFLRQGHWTMEQFIQALDGPRRREMNHFLEQRGPLKATAGIAFMKTWEFFKKRELYGYALTAPSPNCNDLEREVRELKVIRPDRKNKRPDEETLKELKELKKLEEVSAKPPEEVQETSSKASKKRQKTSSKASKKRQKTSSKASKGQQETSLEPSKKRQKASSKPPKKLQEASWKPSKKRQKTSK